MTTFTVPRGQLRALLASLSPLAGKQTSDTPDMGRIRFLPQENSLIAWCTDYGTAGMVRIDIIDHLDDEVDAFDLPVAEVKSILAVIRRPSGQDAAALWDEAPVEVHILPRPDADPDGARRIRLTEVDTLFWSRSVSVPLMLPTLHREGKDQYPDVPTHIGTAIHGAWEGAAARPELYAHTDALSVLTRSAKEWGSRVRLVPVEGMLLAQAGRRFAGLAYRGADMPGGNVPEFVPASRHLTASRDEDGLTASIGGKA